MCWHEGICLNQMQVFGKFIQNSISIHNYAIPINNVIHVCTCTRYCCFSLSTEFCVSHSVLQVKMGMAS